LRDFFLAAVPHVGAIGPGHGEEGFQDFAAEVPVHVVGRVVGK
jgi:hypothetical protein